MKRKRVILTSAAIAAAAAVIICGTMLSPTYRIKAFASYYLQGFLQTLGEGTYFTEYAAALDQGSNVENAYFTIKIPEDFSPAPEMSAQNCDSYCDAGKKNWINVTNTVADENFRLAQVDLNAQYETYLYQPKNLTEGYQKLCGSYPDNAYEEMKYTVLLDTESFDHMDYDKAYAFCQLATLKGIYCWGADTYVYENNGISGIVFVQEVKYTKTQQTAYHVSFMFYDDSDLNQPYCINIITESPDLAYSVINSVRIK